MDTETFAKTLVVGQEVLILAGRWGHGCVGHGRGKVVEITPEVVVVELLPRSGKAVLERFDKKGNSCDGWHANEFGLYWLAPTFLEDGPSHLEETWRG